MTLFDVTGKVALVAGATGSLGSAVSRELAGAGARVMLSGRNEATLKPLADDLAATGATAAYEAGDPVVPDEVQRVVRAAVDRLGGIDILVTAQGMNKPSPIVDQSLDDWRAIVDSQLTATWLFCKEAGRVMIEQGRGGKVVLVGSQRGDLGMPNYTAYSPSKAAVQLLAKTLAWEWGPHGINVNCLAPGLFRSRLTEWMWDDEATYKRLLGRIPIGRLGEAEDFVGTVLYLVSAASDWMTGAVVAVDGGYTAG